MHSSNSERARGARAATQAANPCFRPVALAVALACSLDVEANPLGASVAHGTAAIATQGSTLTVTNSPNAILNWQSFGIGAGETTRFQQQSASSAVLNRVVGADPSQLLGTLSSNGKVFLVNPNGILVGQGARIDVGGLVASSLALSDGDFLKGNLRFTSPAGAMAGTAVANHGSIRTADGGAVYLVGQNVSNAGLISTPGGETLLAAGQSARLLNTGTPGVSVEVTASNNQAINVGSLIADSGRIGMVGALARSSGTINANSLQSQGGRVFLKATGRTEAAGTISADGTKGGSVELLGKEVGVMAGARVSADGAQGGGTVLVGGDQHGGNPAIRNAQVSYVDRTATISANAIRNGNGGKVIVWADNATRAHGRISAHAGASGGDGGFIETSGHYLDVAGLGVDAKAPAGRAGIWLLDPNDITIVHGRGDSNISAGPVFAPVADTANSVLTDASLNAAINGGTAVSVTTAATGAAGAGDILFNPAIGGDIFIRKGLGSYATLSLNAARDIRFMAGTTNLMSSGANGLTIALNPGTAGAGGAIYTDSGATVNLTGGATGGLALVALIQNGRTWQNNGNATINRDGDSTIRLWDGAQYGTFQNSGFLNVNSGGGWAFTGNPLGPTNPLGQDGVLNNDGIINISGGTSFEAKFSQSQNGQIFMSLSPTNFLNIQNPDVISGRISINGILSFPERHQGAAILRNVNISAGTKGAPNSIIPVDIPGTISFGGLPMRWENSGYGQAAGDLNLSRLLASGQLNFAGDSVFSSSGSLTVSSPLILSGGLSLSTHGTEYAIGSGLYAVLPSGPININAPISIGGNLYLASDGHAMNISAPLTAKRVFADSRGSTIDANQVLIATAGAINLASRITATQTQVFQGRFQYLNAAVTLDAGTGSFINTAGSNALTVGAGLNWLILCDNVANNSNTFGGLASGNQALWGLGAGFSSALPITVPAGTYLGNALGGAPIVGTAYGNRYVFQTAPTLAVTSGSNLSKTYGDTVANNIAFANALAGDYAIAGFVNAAGFGNVFTQDTVANSVSGAPLLLLADGAAAAGVAAASYPISLSVGTLKGTTGYGIGLSGGGTVTVIPKSQVQYQPPSVLTGALVGVGAAPLLQVAGQTARSVNGLDVWDLPGGLPELGLMAAGSAPADSLKGSHAACALPGQKPGTCRF